MYTNKIHIVITTSGRAGPISHFCYKFGSNICCTVEILDCLNMTELDIISYAFIPI